MLYLLLAIASSAIISVLMRLSESHVRHNMVMFTANYAVCLGLSRFFMGDMQLFAPQEGIGWAAALGLLGGFLYLASFTLMQKNIYENGVVLSGASMRLGSVLIPVLIAIAIFREQAQWLQLLGVAIAIVAVVLINVEKGDIGQGSKKHWLLALLAVSGITDAMANIYDKTGVPELKNHYLFYIFLAAMCLAFLMALVKKQRPTAADVLWGVLIGIPNYFSSRFLLLALGQVPAVVVYPACSVGTIIVISLVGVLAFRETLSNQKKCALLLILAALALLNL